MPARRLSDTGSRPGALFERTSRSGERFPGPILYKKKPTFLDSVLKTEGATTDRIKKEVRKERFRKKQLF
jgi:hypothetical protein